MKIIDPSEAGHEAQLEQRQAKERRAQNSTANAQSAKRALLIYAGIIALVLVSLMIPRDGDSLRSRGIHRLILSVTFLLPSLAMLGTATAALVFSLRAEKHGYMLLSVAAITGGLGALFVSLLTVLWP